MQARRIAAVLMAVVALTLGAVVVVGIATGHSLEWERGTVSAGFRDAQIALGVVALLALAAVLVTARDFYLDRSAAAIPAFLVAVVLAVAWGFLRVLQYTD